MLLLMCWNALLELASSAAFGALRFLALTREALSSGTSVANLTFHTECVRGPGVRLLSLRLLLHTLAQEPFPGEELRGRGPERTCFQRHPPTRPVYSKVAPPGDLKGTRHCFGWYSATLGFFKKHCLFGCVGSQLQHVRPSRSWGSSIVAHGLWLKRAGFRSCRPCA